MESKSTGRFKLGKQSSLAPDRGCDDSVEMEFPPDVDANIRLMYLANEGDLDGMRELFDAGVDVNFRDIDGRRALHVAACQGSAEVVELLLDRGAKVDVEDRWGSTPLADAIHYKNNEVIKLLEKHGAKLQIAPMHVKNIREIPEYEIDPRELDFTNSVQITKGTFHMATWRGVQVAVKRLDEDLLTDEDKVKAFRDELALLQKIRHPNVVQFLGAVTQSSPMMIVTEYLPKGDLRAFLKRKGALKPLLAVTFGLDIARGMNYLHEHKPEAIIHRDLEPSNILRDDSGLLKVADFGLSKLLDMTKSIREDRPLVCEDNGCRYVAPEVFRNEEYDTTVDMIEGCMPFNTQPDSRVPNLYAAKERPPFRAPPRHYAFGLKELIVQCWSENPAARPTCRDIIERLTDIRNHIIQKQRWKVRALRCFQNIEAIWKDRKDRKDRSNNPSSRSTRSTSSYF
ncbi:serine/threonine-protein kinase STY8-like isoform X2 [Phalaenopsis equestris]|uniref:serine/threonine-protein kinase STY8-like isoform X2 n=1 Tax=Phalaenopsis equestris TaxID=78828 RepID=UPI0009E36D60|nr:serine/threonine-protein kinase STY8-like isoform X2 [Phalaenopsis equestris]